jgi:hypothetical protein
LHLISGLIREVVFGERCLIREVVFGERGLIREVVFGERGLIREVVFGERGFIRRRLLYLIFVGLTPLSTIFQLYGGSQFY